MSKNGENNNITFNNLLGFTISSAVRFGWNSLSDFAKVSITNCEFVQTAYAAISLHELRNNAIYDQITFSSCWFDTETMVGWRDEVVNAYVFFKVYGPDFGDGFVKANTVSFQNCNIVKQGCIYFVGDTAFNIRNIVFNNVTMEGKKLTGVNDIRHFKSSNVGKITFLNH